jgi:hypothetical protein
MNHPPSGGLDHRSGPDAAGADCYFLNPAVLEDPDALQVGIKATLGQVVGVADMVSDLGPLATDFADFGHGSVLLFQDGVPNMGDRPRIVSGKRVV